MMPKLLLWKSPHVSQNVSDKIAKWSPAQEIWARRGFSLQTITRQSIGPTWRLWASIKARSLSSLAVNVWVSWLFCRHNYFLIKWRQYHGTPWEKVQLTAFRLSHSRLQGNGWLLPLPTLEILKSSSRSSQTIEVSSSTCKSRSHVMDTKKIKIWTQQALPAIVVQQWWLHSGTFKWLICKKKNQIQTWVRTQIWWCSPIKQKLF